MTPASCSNSLLGRLQVGASVYLDKITNKKKRKEEMKNVILTSSNGNSITINTNDNATVKDVLSSVEAQTFFGHSSQDIQNALDSVSGQPVAGGLRVYVLGGQVENNAVLGVGLATANTSASTVSTVPGTVTLLWQGGIKTVTLAGLPIGEATVADCINNPMTRKRFALEGVSMNSLEVMLNMDELKESQINTVKVKDGDRIAVQTRQAKDKGAEKAEFYDVKSKSKVAAEVIGKVEFANGRFALKGKLTDGRTLYRFVAKSVFDKSKAPATKPEVR